MPLHAIAAFLKLKIHRSCVKVHAFVEAIVFVANLLDDVCADAAASNWKWRMGNTAFVGNACYVFPADKRLMSTNRTCSTKPAAITFRNWNVSATFVTLLELVRLQAMGFVLVKLA